MFGALQEVCAEVAIMISHRHIHMFHESCKPYAVRLFLQHAFFSTNKENVGMLLLRAFVESVVSLVTLHVLTGRC
jgi:hypothetical protein